MPTHSPAATGYLLPREFQRSCYEMDIVACYKGYWDVIAEGDPRDLAGLGEFRRMHLDFRRKLIACFTAHGWERQHIRELCRGIVQGMPVRPERPAVTAA